MPTAGLGSTKVSTWTATTHPSMKEAALRVDSSMHGCVVAVQVETFVLPSQLWAPKAKQAKFQNLKLSFCQPSKGMTLDVQGYSKGWKHLVWQDKERVPSASVCCILYLIALLALAPNIVSLALLYLWRRKHGGYPLLDETSLRQF